MGGCGCERTASIRQDSHFGCVCGSACVPRLSGSGERITSPSTFDNFEEHTAIENDWLRLNRQTETVCLDVMATACTKGSLYETFFVRVHVQTCNCDVLKCIALMNRLFCIDSVYLWLRNIILMFVCLCESLCSLNLASINQTRSHTNPSSVCTLHPFPVRTWRHRFCASHRLRRRICTLTPLAGAGVRARRVVQIVVEGRLGWPALILRWGQWSSGQTGRRSACLCGRAEA